MLSLRNDHDELVVSNSFDGRLIHASTIAKEVVDNVIHTGLESSPFPGGRSDIQLFFAQMDGLIQNLCDKLYSSFEPLTDITSIFTPQLEEFDSSPCSSVGDLHTDDACELDLVSTTARIDVLLKHMADA